MKETKYWRHFNVWFWILLLIPLAFIVAELIYHQINPDPCGLLSSSSDGVDLLLTCPDDLADKFFKLAFIFTAIAVLLNPFIAAYYSKKIVDSLKYFYVGVAVFLLQIIFAVLMNNSRLGFGTVFAIILSFSILGYVYLALQQKKE